jgi:hypothetical protein
MTRKKDNGKKNGAVKRIGRIKQTKKGQLAIFILIGLFIAIIAIAVFVTNNYIQNQQAQQTEQRQIEIITETDSIEQFIQQCIRQTTVSGLELMGQKAGYINPPSVIRFGNTAYWHLDEVNIQPTLEQTQLQLERYIETALPACLDFSSFEMQGVGVTYTPFAARVSFTAERTVIVLNSTVTIEGLGFTRELYNFNEDINVPWRRMYELATQINMRQLDGTFKFSQPLNDVITTNFDVSFRNSGKKILVYSVIDRTQFVQGEHFTLQFASRLTHSDLKRTIEFDGDTTITPSVLPQTIYSVDRMAQLVIHPGITMNLHGQPIDNITVQQFYPNNVTREQVPFIEHADDTVTNGTITWNLTYPIYEFKPTGLRFNQPQRLLLFWDEDRVPHQGNMGILYTDGAGGWRPLVTKANYDVNVVGTDIPGFSSYTPVDCGVQPLKEISVTAKLDPGGSCVGKLVTAIVIFVVIIAIFIVVVILTAGWGVAAAPAFQVPSGLVGAATVVSTAATQVVTAVASLGLYLGIGLGLVVIGVSVIGGAYYNAAQAYSTQTDTVTFTPTCDQAIEVQKFQHHGSGKCIPSGVTEVDGAERAYKDGREVLLEAGQPQPIQAVTKKCGGWRSMFCGKCRTTCTTKYR